MSIANIMVSLDAGPAAAGRVRLAAGLAERFEATLTGVAARKIPGPGPVGSIADAQAAYDAERIRLFGDLTRAKGTFEDGAGSGIRTVWHEAESGPGSFLVRLARGADLVVVGAAREDKCAMAVEPGAVLMEAGRPVLVVPPDRDDLRAARIVVAWKDTPEARRAVSAALPFIRRADQVYVVAVGDQSRFVGAEDVSELLARHGAHVTTHLLHAPADDIADEILRFAERQDADLAVMGGYGHSRLREWLFGGVTHDVLRRSPLCCLMSH